MKLRRITPFAILTLIVGLLMVVHAPKSFANPTETVFNSADTPAVAVASDDNAIELAMTFTPQQSGTINGIRFYKGLGATGTHVGSIWSSTGTLLKSGTFTSETSSGWQQLNFGTALSVTGGTTYVVGYHAPNGGYSYTDDYWTSNVGTGTDLVATASGNDTYRYASTNSAFPSLSYNATNYWVDVVFTPTGTAGGGGNGGSGISLPSGVTLTSIDGSPTYYSQWTNSFPLGVEPVGVFPFELAPANLASMGINFATPARDDNHGAWTPQYSSNPNGNDQAGLIAAGMYGGGDYEGANCTTAQDSACSPAIPWGSSAVFNVYGDELDGQCSGGLFSNNPMNVTTPASTCGSWGGTTDAGLEGANAATYTNDSSRPVYDQFTTTLMDGNTGVHYTFAQKQAICASTGIFSFDIYPLDKRGGSVYDTYDQVQEARNYCGDDVPVFPFIEMDNQDGGTIYPLPAQTKAETWDAIIAGADGIQYFDQNWNITSATYTGNGNYSAGAMHSSISGVDTTLAALAPEIQSDTAAGYVTPSYGVGGGNVSILAKYYDGHFWLFVGSHQQATQTVTFTIAGSPSGTVAVHNESRNLTMTSGTFTDTFSSANAIHIYQMP